MNGLQIFTKKEFGSVRVVEHEGEPWFVASDVAKALGYERPADAVNIHCKKTNKITQYCDSPDRVKTPPINLNIIPESDVYRLVMRSNLPSAVEFQDWICEEVIPAIRKTGAYGVPALPNFRNPAEAARAWADKEEQRLLEERKRLALEQRMEEVRPKVVFAESIEVARTSILVGEMAKLVKQATGYDIGQNRFFEWLRNRGYLHKSGSQTNMPTQRCIDNGWMEIKEGARIGSSGESHITRTPKITGKGQIYFINLFKKLVEP